MCLAIPVKIVKKNGTEGIVEFGNVKKKVDLRLVEDVKVGDYVILHAGFAIQQLDEKEANETLELLRLLNNSYHTPTRKDKQQGTKDR